MFAGLARNTSGLGLLRASRRKDKFAVERVGPVGCVLVALVCVCV